MAPRPNRYDSIIERIFFRHYTPGAHKIEWHRDDIDEAVEALGVSRPKNYGDVPYTYRFRRDLPANINAKVPDGLFWIIRFIGRGKYRFDAVEVAEIKPNRLLGEIKIPDATPGIIASNALNDEQALLAKLRYNRLLDIFSGVTCYSLQSHLRTYIEGLGQAETDELYVGVGRHGAQYVLPVQAKGGTDRLGIVQIEQDLAICREKFPHLTCRAIAAQFITRGGEDLIALFEFAAAKGVESAMVRELHYRLVPPSDISQDELDAYRDISQQQAPYLG